jgi:glycosyltransferase involved in cell wall biosynthesis
MANGLQIYREHVSDGVMQRIVKGLTLFEKEWVKPLNRFIHEFKPDILHVHDFTLLKTVLSVAESVQIPVVADLHENMPAALAVYREAFPFYLQPLDAVIHNYHWWRWHEKTLLPRCAQIFVVVPEAAERLFQYGIPPEKISIVSNTESETTFALDHLDSEITTRYQGLWIASYIGGMGPHRGVDTAIRAVPDVILHIPNFRLLIIGVNQSALSHLTKLIHRLGVEKYVELIGWQPFEKVNTFVSLSTACLVPHNDFEHTQTTVPHKLFQYMLVKKPVIVSDVRPLKRIVEETRSGLVFKADDPSSLAEKLAELYDQPVMAQEFGRNGYAAASGPYSWEHDAQKLVDTYRRLEESTTKGS